MWEDFGKALTNVAFAGVGLAALAAEQVVKAGKVLAEKGEIYVEQGKRYGEELQQKLQEDAQRRREEQLEQRISAMDAQEREALRRRLAELDELERQAREAAAQAEEAAPGEGVPRSPRSTAAPRSTTARNHEANGQAGCCPAWPFAMCLSNRELKLRKDTLDHGKAVLRQLPRRRAWVDGSNQRSTPAPRPRRTPAPGRPRAAPRSPLGPPYHIRR
ncbi:MAG: hypothetical protein ACLRIS_00280 [Flavonifractor plautii]